MRRKPMGRIAAAILLLLMLAARLWAGEILLEGNDPLAVTAVNPDRPGLAAEEAALGGLDAGLPGDDSYYRLSVTSVGKRFYQTPDSISLLVETTQSTGAVLIEIGVFRSSYGSASGVALWNGEPILDLDARGGTDQRLETLSHVLAPEPGVHQLTLADRPGEGTYLTVDAIRLTAEGDLRLVDRSGAPIDTRSRSLPPRQADALLPKLLHLTDLAVFTPETVWRATENFPVETYSAAAAFDGMSDDGNYWAGGTPAPHAICVQYPAPITFDTNRVLWLGENRAVVYGLEAWDGERWNLVYHEPRNLQEQPIYAFEPVTTDRIRFTMYAFTGQERVLMQAFELYDRGSDLP